MPKISLKFLTWNVRGLRDNIKRAAALTFIKKQRADVVTLVETHIEGRLQMTLRRPWVGWAFHSTHTSHSRGISVLIAKTVHFELCELHTDPQGRFIFISAKLHGEPFLILAVYVPPPFSTSILLEGISFIAKYPTAQTIWMGDFNSTLNEELDRLRPTPPATNPPRDTKLARLFSPFHLMDTWRHKHPHTRKYSCFSATHNTMSRIDFIFISQNLLARLLETEFGPRLLSDHAPYWITLTFHIDKPPTSWRLNPFWLTLLPEDDDLSAEWETFFLENTSTASFPIVWETFKIHARATLITRINKIKANSSDIYERAETEFSRIEHIYQNDPSQANASHLKLQSRIMNQLQYEKARQKLFFAKQKYFEQGERAGKLLAFLARNEDKPPVVIALHSPEGQKITDPPVVSSKFREFFMDLYNSRTQEGPDDMISFLEGVAFPQLTPEQRELLEAPLTKEEIDAAIASFAKSKSPGSDGLPIEFYSHYNEIITPKLLTLYNVMFQQFTLPPSMGEATIVLIPKPGKDLGHPESYRPISLLQADIKILAKILAMRLNQVILNLIHADQAGFMPGRNTSFNLRKLFINLQATHENVGTRVIVTLDTAKAFDSVEWGYLWCCLERYGFGPNFIQWVQLLYQNPTARVVANGWPSQKFDLHRGTRQGCPLSPLLYALAAEPLAVSIRTDPEIIGLKTGTLTEKISMYADDTLLYLADPGPSLHRALQTIERFGKFSGLKINWGKSQVLPIDTFPPTEFQATLPLQRVDTIKYLGINTSKNPADYITLNIKPLYSLIKTKTQSWTRLPLGVWGRINLIKMILLPKILYILWHTPTYIPLKHFKIMESLLKPFVWGKNRHKIAWQTLKNPTDMGGTALPDLNHYYIASQLSQLYHIDKVDSERFRMLICPQWAQETSDSIYAITVGTKTNEGNTHKTSLLYQYRRIWELANNKLNIPRHNDFTPLWCNRDLPELHNIHDPRPWLERGILYLHHVWSNGTLKNFDTLKEEFHLANNMVFRFLQLRHAIQAQFPQPPPRSAPNPLIAIIKDTDPKKLISCFYNMLTIPIATKITYGLKSRWERDLGNLENEEWEEALDTCKEVSPKLSDRLTQLNIIHRTYLTPHRIARYKHNCPTVCPMCKSTESSFYHLLWSCPQIQGLWKQIVTFLHDNMGSPVTLDPKQCLLGVFPSPMEKYTKVFLQETLFSCRKIIARKWMRPLPPEIKEWKAEVNGTLPYKRVIYINRGCPDKHNRIWDRWLQDSETCS